MLGGTKSSHFRSLRFESGHSLQIRNHLSENWGDFLLTTEIPQTGFRNFSDDALFLRPAALFIGYGASMFGEHLCRLCRF